MMREHGKSTLFTTTGILLAAVLLAACAGPPPAPARESASSFGAYSGTPDGSYRVRRGDSLHAIAFKFGLDWREIARLNGISEPYTIYPDQLLRLTDSVQQTAPGSKAFQPATGSSEVQIVAVPSPESTTSSAPDGPRSTTVTITQPVPGSAPVTTPTPTEITPPGVPDKPPVERAQAPMGASYTPPAGDPSRWIWPTEGRVISSFQAGDPSRKGIDISGSAGQAVTASAAGQVVYSGSGLIGYGELVIIKHSDRMLSAYAHNSKRLVVEGEQVLAGGQIAEMGTNDRNQMVLHFEIRVNGSPQDPLKYLPKR
jgi:lipoprotein NlpD